MNNFQYLKNHYNNFIYPKPTEDIEEDYLKKNRRSISDPTIFFHRIFPEKKFSKEKSNKEKCYKTRFIVVSNRVETI